MTVPVPGITMPTMPTMPSLDTQNTIGDPTGAATAANGTDFAKLLSQGIDNLQGLQNNASNLAVQAATGDLNSIQDYTVASTEASVATQLAVTLRNQAVSAFNQIMQMQV
jgi:flagellar hook-basal body complex protein FliE